MEYYTYIHLKDNQPIYVGKGKNNRAYTKRDYDNYTVKIIDKNISEAQALELEEFLIQEIGIVKLKNKLTKGNLSRKIAVDYKNFKRYKKSLWNMTAKQISQVANQIVDDACDGNLDAIKICLPCIKINDLPRGLSNVYR
jgi:aspartate oxidase